MNAAVTINRQKKGGASVTAFPWRGKESQGRGFKERREHRFNGRYWRKEKHRRGEANESAGGLWLLLPQKSKA